MARGRELFLEGEEALLLDTEFDPQLLRPYKLVLSLRDAGNPAAARDALRKAIAGDPDNPELHHELGHALQELGDYEAAIASFRARLRLEAAVAEGHSDLGWVLYRTGDFEGAEAELLRALELDPGYYRASAALARVEWVHGDLEAALAHGRAAAVDNPSPSAYQRATLALILLCCEREELRDVEEALWQTGRLIELEPEDGEYLGLHGFALYRAGQLEACVDAITRAFPMRDGDDVLNKLVLAMALHDLGKEAEARRWYDEAAGQLDADADPAHYEVRLRGEVEALLGIQNEKERSR
jgi:Flp pilus assembly protein TadD